MGVITGDYVPFIDSDSRLSIHNEIDFQYEGNSVKQYIEGREYFEALNSFEEAERLVEQFLKIVKNIIIRNSSIDSYLHSQIIMLNPYCFIDSVSIDYGYSSDSSTFRMDIRKFEIGMSIL